MFDAPGPDQHHGAVEAVVGDEQVAAAADHEPVVVAPGVADVRDELVGGVRGEQATGGSPDAQGREVGEEGVGHDQRNTTVTCALPSTVCPAAVTVRSMRCGRPWSSTVPTLATTPTVAPCSGSTTTGRVKRTP